MSIYKLVFGFTAFCVNLGLLNAICSAQTLSQAKLVCRNPLSIDAIQVLWNPGFNEQADIALAKSADQYFIVQTRPTPPQIILLSVSDNHVPSPLPNSLFSFKIKSPPSPSIDLNNPNAEYVLNTTGLTFKGKPIASQQTQVVIPDECRTPQFLEARAAQAAQAASTQTTTGVKLLKVEESDNREDSNLYIQGEIVGSRKTKAYKSLDLKFELPVQRVTLNNDTVEREFSLLFDSRLNTNPKADPDSLKFAFQTQFTFYNQTRSNEKERSRKEKDRLNRLTGERETGIFIRTYQLQFSPVIEADRDFDNLNLIGEARVLFPFKIQTKARSIPLNFFIGLEAGKNLKSPLAEAEGNGIFRPLVGANITFEPFRTNTSRPIVFETSYIRRWLLKQEIGLEEDNDGNLSAVFFSKKPRDFVESKLTINIYKKYFGTYISYQYGQLPPAYKLVDSSFKAGLVFKFKFPD